MAGLPTGERLLGPSPALLTVVEDVVDHSVSSDSGELLSQLGRFPPETERAFEARTVKLANELENPEAALQPILADRSIDEQVRYAAFFTLGTSYRRLKDTSKLNELIRAHATDFTDRGTYHHLRSMAVRQRGGAGDFQDAYRYARQAMRILPDHAGLLHSFGSLIVDAQERGEELGVDREHLLAEAHEAIEGALELDPEYPKFYVTLGRWFSLSNNFAAARAAVIRAIDLEDSSGRDYFVRIADYNSHLSAIQVREASAKLQTDLDDARERVESIERRVQDFVSQAESRYLQMLAFFAAVVALIVSGVQIAGTMDATAAAALLVVLAGALLTAFAGLGLLVTDRVRRIAGVAVFGLALIAGGLFLID